jgi:hypothetical protein
MFADFTLDGTDDHEEMVVLEPRRAWKDPEHN